MNRRIKTIAVALATTTFASINTASAGGHGRIAGLVIGIARNHTSSSRTPLRGTSSHQHTSNYSNYPTHPTHTPVVQSQPVYSQPQYSQPVYSQSAPSNTVYSHSSVPMTTNPVNPIQNVTPVIRQASVRQASGGVVNQMLTPTSSIAQVNVPPAATSGSPQSSNGNTDQSEVSALQLLASISGESTTESLAVEIPEFTAVAAPIALPASSDHIGTWAVALPGNQSIMLVLDHDGSFAWDATKEGKSSSFAGQYRLEDGRLTLVRSNDLQQMTGSWIGEGNTFAFKLDGAETSGLTFTRNSANDFPSAK